MFALIMKLFFSINNVSIEHFFNADCACNGMNYVAVHIAIEISTAAKI